MLFTHRKSISVPISTEKAYKRTANLLREYLSEKNHEVNFELYFAEQLNDVLKHFYLETRKPDDEMYRINSLELLSQYILKSPPYLKNFYDVTLL